MRAKSCVEYYWPSTFTPTCPTGPGLDPQSRPMLRDSYKYSAVLSVRGGMEEKGWLQGVPFTHQFRCCCCRAGETEPWWIGIRCFCSQQRKGRPTWKQCPRWSGAVYE